MSSLLKEKILKGSSSCMYIVVVSEVQDVDDAKTLEACRPGAGADRSFLFWGGPVAPSSLGRRISFPRSEGRCDDRRESSGWPSLFPRAGEQWLLPYRNQHRNGRSSCDRGGIGKVRWMCQHFPKVFRHIISIVLVKSSVRSACATSLSNKKRNNVQPGR